MHSNFGLIVALLLIYAIGWVFVTYVWPFLVEVVFPIAGIFLVIFLVIAFGFTLEIALSDLYRSFAMVRDRRRRAARVYLHGEAEVAYLFGPVREDVQLFLTDGLRRAVDHVRSAAGRIEIAGNWIERQFYRLNWLFAVTFGMLTAIAVSAVVALVCLIAAIVLAVAFVVLHAIDLGYMALRGVFAYCPECHHKSFHLHYDCPHCKGRPLRHRHLRVNRAGALYHTCTCGGRVPAHILSGRGKGMNAFCTRHEHPINSDLIGARATHVALVGGPDSGKTTVLVGLLRAFLRDPAHKAAGFRLEDPIQRRRVEEWIRDLDAGTPPPKTTKQRHRAATVLYDGSDGERRSLYLFDPSGEMFSDKKLMASHDYFESSDIIMFMLDPLSMKHFRESAITHLGAAAVNAATPCETLPIAVASSLISLMDANGARRQQGRFVVPVLLVVTKSDILEIGRGFGSAQAIRNWIGRNGGEETLRLLDANFSDIRISHVSHKREAAGMRQTGLDELTSRILGHAATKGRHRLRRA